MDEIPLALRLRDQPCLCVGGGSVVARRLPSLLASGARVTLIAPSLHADVADLARASGCTHLARPFAPGDCAGMFLVLAATGERNVDAAVATEARVNRSLICVASDPDLGNCLFMGVVRRGPLVVAMHTGGAAPAVSGALRRLIDAQLPESLGEILEALAEERSTLRQREPDPARRAASWRAVVESGALDRALGGGAVDALKEIRRVLAGNSSTG